MTIKQTQLIIDELKELKSELKELKETTKKDMNLIVEFIDSDYDLKEIKDNNIKNKLYDEVERLQDQIDGNRNDIAYVDNCNFDDSIESWWSYNQEEIIEDLQKEVKAIREDVKGPLLFLNDVYYYEIKTYLDLEFKQQKLKDSECFLKSKNNEIKNLENEIKELEKTKENYKQTETLNAPAKKDK